MSTSIPLHGTQTQSLYSQHPGVSHVSQPLREEITGKEMLEVAQEYKTIYVQIAAIAAVVAVIIGLALYAIKPDFLLRVKGDKQSGVSTANLIAICVI